jgi:hypothetical protein
MVITCTNDQEAIAQAKQMFDGHDLEVWQKARFVIRFKPAAQS